MDSKLLFGTSPAIQQILAACQKYALAIAPVLILGESGTGKTALATHLHTLSARSGAFVKQSVPVLPENLEVTGLQGHSRGAFTGAYRDAIGAIEQARGGTFFLDEIGLAPPRVQEMLLTLIEDRAVTRVGEARSRPVDAWWILATNVDLVEAVRVGTFRKDLLARFGYCRIRLPGLAERRDEILPLLRQNLVRESALARRPVPQLSRALVALLEGAPWPDNIRQLESVVRYLVIHAEGTRELQPADLPLDFLDEMGVITGQGRTSKMSAALARHVLSEHRGNRAAAAKALRVSRRHLYRLLALPEEKLAEEA